MAILRPMLESLLGNNQPITAPSRRRRNTMTQPQFYQQEAQPVSQPAQSQPAPNVTPGQQSQQSFVQAPQTGDYLRNQLQRYQQRTAPPQLEPAARIKSPAAELVQPSAFRKYYDQLNTITAIGQERLVAEQAKGVHRQNQALQAARTVPSVGSGSGTSTTRPATGNVYGSVPSNPRANFAFAQQVAPNYGWGPGELGAWYTLGMKESGWNHNAQNPTSTAYGIGQFLNSTWKTVGGAKTNDPRSQVDYMAKYIKQRYGSPSAALAFHLRNNWY